MLGSLVRNFSTLVNAASTSPNGAKMFIISSSGHSVTEGILVPTNKTNKEVITTTEQPVHPDVVDGFVEVGKHPNLYYFSTERQATSFLVPFKRLSQYTESELKKHVPSTHYGAIEYAFKFYSYLDTISDMHSLNFGSHRVIVSNTFDSDYSEFLERNKKAVKPIFEKYVNSNNPLAKFVYVITDGNPAFFGWAIKMIWQYQTSLFSLMHLMDFNKETPNLIKKLNKGNLIALASSKDVVDAVEESFFLRAQANANKALNWFNSNQKKILKDCLNDSKFIHTINSFSRLSTIKRINFIRKVSTIDDANEIIRMMSFLCSNTHFDWSKESLIDFIENVEGLDCNIVLNRDNIVVVRVNTFDTIKRLGKTTNWCISKNLSYWEQYIQPKKAPRFRIAGHEEAFDMPAGGDVMYGDRPKKDRSVLNEIISILDSSDELDNNFISFLKEQLKKKNELTDDRRQYMVFDFNKKEDDEYSIIGLTISDKNGITSAHNFVNTGMMNNSISDDMFYGLNRWFNLENDYLSIKTFLEKHNLPLNLFKEKEETKSYEWSKDGILRFISNFIAPDEYHVVYENGTDLLIESTSLKLSVVLDDCSTTYMTIKSNPNYSGKTFWYFDFSKDITDLDRIIFWEIERNSATNTEITSEPFDASGGVPAMSANKFKSFNDMLSKFNLPFDIIRRPDNVKYKASRIFRVSDYGDMINYIKENPEVLSNKKVRDNLFSFLSTSVIELDSLDVYKKVKELNIPFTKLIGESNIYKLLPKYYEHLCRTFSIDRRVLKKVDTIEALEAELELIQNELARIPRRPQGPRMIGHPDDAYCVLREKGKAMIYYFIIRDLTQDCLNEGLTEILWRNVNQLLHILPRTLQNHFRRGIPSFDYIELFKDIIEVWTEKRNNYHPSEILNNLFYLISCPDYDFIVKKIIDMELQSESKVNTVKTIVNNLLAAYTANYEDALLVRNYIEYTFEKAMEYNILTKDNVNKIKSTISLFDSVEQSSLTFTTTNTTGFYATNSNTSINSGWYIRQR